MDVLGTLPGEDEDAYNGFFDELEHVFNDPVKVNVGDDLEKISIPEEELKQIIDQVDQAIDVNEERVIKPVEPKIRAPDGSNDNTILNNLKKPRHTFNPAKDRRPSKAGKHNANSKNSEKTNKAENMASDWTYKQVGTLCNISKKAFKKYVTVLS